MNYCSTCIVELLNLFEFDSGAQYFQCNWIIYSSWKTDHPFKKSFSFLYPSVDFVIKFSLSGINFAKEWIRAGKYNDRNLFFFNIFFSLLLFTGVLGAEYAL